MIAHRQATADDLPFIYSTWVRTSLASPLAKHVLPSTHQTAQRQLAERLLIASQVLVASLEDEPAVILGYLIYRPGVVHYAHVKKVFERRGILSGLLDAADLDIEECHLTHFTYDCLRLLKRWPRLRYNPYLLMEI